MKVSALLATALIFGLELPAAAADNADVPPGDKTPLLRLQAGGPTSLVTALAFSPDGQTLYAGGLDKVVRVWTRSAASGAWEEQPAFRIPLGPGNNGMINAIALSKDGNWLAVGGVGLFRSRAGFREPGVVLPALMLDAPMRQDLGNIYVFDVKTRAVRVLRGHEGNIVALAFAPAEEGQAAPPPLVSAARQWQDRANEYAGAVWVWDVAQRTHRAWPGQLPDLAKQQFKRPALAIWRTLGRAQDLQIAFAWGDGRLRHWDLARGRAGVSQPADARYNFTAAYLPDQDKLLTGAYRGVQGYLQVWNLPAGKAPDQRGTVPTGLNKQVVYVPMALAVFASKLGGKPDQAAVVLRVKQGERQHTRLHLLDLDPRRFGTLQASLPLWTSDESHPTLAASPDGRFLALVGDEGHTIRIYSVADVRAKEGAAEPVLLASQGAAYRSLAFARKKDHLGLVLSTRRKPAKEDPIFDFFQPGLVDPEGWQADAPPRGDWQADLSTTRLADNRVRHAFTVRQGDNKMGTLTLEPDQLVTAFALLPPCRPLDRPLLAVAVYQYGEPALLLGDVKSGQIVRHYAGHDAVIRSLAFSADGRLLASASDDQTVCVWTLTDLAKTLGQHGLIPGLALRARGQAVVVARVDKDSPAARKLEVDDVIQSLTPPQGAKIPLTSAGRYYRAVWETKPGDTIRLDVKGKGQVDLVVGQGVDERKPLLTLFIDRDRRHWLGWDLFGRYDVSARAAERYLGWHFNTGQADRPTQFVTFRDADEYRRKYYRKGLLQELIAKADPTLVAAVKPPRLPPPRITVLVGETVLDPARADGRGRILIQPHEPVLRVAVHEFPKDRIASVHWQIDAGPLHAFDPAPGLEWSAPLPPKEWKRGVRKINVLVKTSEPQPRQFPEERQALYLPPPPEVTTALPTSQVVMNQAFALTARVRPALAGQEVEVRVRLNGAAVATMNAVLPALALQKTLTLKGDDNLIEVVAVNKGALAGHEAAETTRLPLEVVYKPTRPQIVVQEVVLQPGQGSPALAVRVRPNEPVVVTVPTLRLRGQVSAAETLTAALRDGKHTLHGFQPNTAKTFPINETFRLTQPGRQEVTLLVKTANTQAKKVLAIDYRPPLPRIDFRPPLEALIYYDEGNGPPRLSLLFQLTPRAEGPEGKVFGVEAHVNDAILPADQVALEKETGKLTIRFTPQETRSRVRVRLTSAWSEPENSEVVEVRYLRPPYRLAFVNPPKDTRNPVITLTARVRSPLPLVPDAVSATVNGRAITATSVERADGDTWLIRLKDISLDDTKNSKNVIALNVANRDGECRQPAEHTVVFLGPPAKRPEVVILSPASGNITDPEVVVRLRVRSDTPLQRLALTNADAPAGQPIDVSGLPQDLRELKLALRLVPGQVRAPLKIKSLQPDAEGFRHADLALGLVRGLNNLSLVATNEGGDSLPPAVVGINYVPLPVRLVLDKLVPADGDGPAIPAEVVPAGKFLRFARKAPVARLWLHGRVVWSRAQDERLQDATWVRARVNGVQQVAPVRLDKPAAQGSHERAFRLGVLLNRTQDNQLEIDLPDLAQEDGSRAAYLIDCLHPLQEKRYLHLLIVGIGEEDGGKLKARILKALGATPAARQEFTLKTFERGRVYGPLVGDVEPDTVYYQLLLMKSRIDLLSRDGPSSHVVLVYYHGGEAVSRRGHYLRTSRRQSDPELAHYRIPCDELEKRLADTLGAKILLLDVARDARAEGRPRDQDRVANWPSRSYVAVMRYAQLGPNAPLDEARLLKAWEQALAQAARLKEVEDRIERLAKQFNAVLRRRNQSLLYDWFIPQSLWDLVIGPKS
jgi:WD40 repeat protein